MPDTPPTPETPPPLLRWNQGSRGRIARLPKVVRDKLNRMMQDGVMYEDILKALGPDAAELNTSSLVRWRKSGHQQWLKERERLEQMKHMRELALEFIKENQGKPIEEAGLQIAASHIYSILMDFDTADLKQKLQEDPELYPRLMNMFSRLSDRGLKFEHYRAHVAQQKAKLEQALAIAETGGVTKDSLDDFRRSLKLL